MREATINDVAQAAGVSLRTVSRVLNNSPKVSIAARARIDAAIQKLGFTPSSRARALAQGRSFLIGLIYDDPNALVLDEIQRGMVGVCALRGFEVVIHPCSYHAPHLLDDLAAFVRRSRVDGVVVVPPVSERGDVAAVLNELGVAAAFITAVAAADAALIIDERSAAESMARHLLALGHRRFGFISGPAHFQSAIERGEGFMQAIREQDGCEVVAEQGDYGFASGLACAGRLLAHEPRPTAIFASNDLMAAGVFKAAAQVGLSIPGDLSVAGFDDSAVAEILSPALTTIRRPMRDLATEATHRLLARLDDPGAGASPVAPQIELSLIVRDSTAAPSL